MFWREFNRERKKRGKNKFPLFRTTMPSFHYFCLHDPQVAARAKFRKIFFFPRWGSWCLLYDGLGRGVNWYYPPSCDWIERRGKGISETLGSQIGRNRKRGLRKYGGRHVTRRICDVRLLSELMSAISKSSGSDLVFLVDFRRHQATTPAIARPCPATRRP